MRGSILLQSSLLYTEFKLTFFIHPLHCEHLISIKTADIFHFCTQLLKSHSRVNISDHHFPAETEFDEKISAVLKR
jgi:hypothetical protein